MATIVATERQPRLWVDGDLNGFFGLFTNVLLNVIDGVRQLPDHARTRTGQPAKMMIGIMQVLQRVAD